MRAHSILLLPLLLAAGCGRWMDYAPVNIKGTTTSPQTVFNQVVQRSTALGYAPELMSPRQRYFRVRANLDRRPCRCSRASWFHVQVLADGSVNVAADGHHVRAGGVIHRKLCRELTMYLDGLAAVLGSPPVVAGL